MIIIITQINIKYYLKFQTRRLFFNDKRHQRNFYSSPRKREKVFEGDRAPRSAGPLRVSTTTIYKLFVCLIILYNIVSSSSSFSQVSDSSAAHMTSCSLSHYSFFLLFATAAREEGETK